MKVINGCEESQSVTIEMRKLGIEAYSCDTEPCSGGHPEWHLQMDIFEAIKLKDWDMGIFFPPCTRLTVTANKWYKPEFSDRFPNIHEEREMAVLFFMRLAKSNIEKICIENPVGIMSTRWRKPDQYIQPYEYGHPERKKTCLWLKNLPKLMPTEMVEPEMYTYKNGKKDPIWHFESIKLPEHERSKFRSKTFSGIAKAMAEQWKNKYQ